MGYARYQSIGSTLESALKGASEALEQFFQTSVPFKVVSATPDGYIDEQSYFSADVARAVTGWVVEVEAALPGTYRTEDYRK